MWKNLEADVLLRGWGAPNLADSSTGSALEAVNDLDPVAPANVEVVIGLEKTSFITPLDQSRVVLGVNNPDT